MTFNNELNSIQLPNPDLDDPPEGMLVQLRGVTADVCEIWEDTPQPKCLHLIAQEWSSSNEISLTVGSKQANSLPLSHTHRWSEASTLERLRECLCSPTCCLLSPSVAVCSTAFQAIQTAVCVIRG